MIAAQSLSECGRAGSKCREQGSCGPITCRLRNVGSKYQQFGVRRRGDNHAGIARAGNISGSAIRGKHLYRGFQGLLVNTSLKIGA